jgi:hypothetical protein
MPTPRDPILEIHTGLQLKGQLAMDKDVVLTGRFEGDLQTAGCLTVAPGGVAVGSIEAGALVLEDGNRVEARIRVGSVPPRGALKKERSAAGKAWPLSLKKIKEFAQALRK